MKGWLDRAVVNSLSTELNQKFIVPLLLDYVYWVIQEAEKRGIKTLYFLARDGYLLQKIAVQLCEREHIPICCNYLYCSRMSLRMPVYSLIGKEALDILLLDGYQVSRKSLLDRVNLSREERCAVWKDCGEIIENEERLLNYGELERVRKKLKNSRVFYDFVIEKSKSAYLAAVGYLRQEGFLDLSKVAVVDSGWTGSMQRSLRQLLQSAGFQGEIIGFYFGMYADPKEAADGTYLTYYFNKTGKTWDKIHFCNNLFECLLQAPHGMTLGYKTENGRYFPQMVTTINDDMNYEQIRIYTQEVIDLAWIQGKEKPFRNFDCKKARKETRKRIRRFMAHPTREEAAFFGKILFCDDVTEKYHACLASSAQTKQLKQYLILHRVRKRLFSRSKEHTLPELYWPYGTIAFLPIWQQAWYRWNVYVWEWLKYILKK